MSKRSATLGFPTTGPEALRAADAALTSRGWSVAPQPGGLLAREDPVRLHCHCWPAEARISVERSDELGTVLGLKVHVPGAGPISGRHAQEQLESVARAIAGAAPSEAGRG